MSPLRSAAVETAPFHAGQALVRGLCAVAGLALLCNIGALAVPLFNMEVFNRVLATHNLETLVALAAGLAIGVLSWGAFDWLRTLALQALGARLVRQVAAPLLRAVAAGAGGPTAGPDALRDLEGLRGFVASPACLAPFDMAWVPVLLAVLLVLHWGYALLGVLCCVVLGILNVLGDAMLRGQTRAAATANALATAAAAAAVRAAEPVLAMNMLPDLARRWAAEERDAAAGGARALLRARAVLSATRALRLGMTGAMVALGLVLVLGGSASPGSMIAGNMILSRLLLPFEALAGTYRQWIEAAAAWRRVRVALAATVPVRATEPMPCPHGRLVVERLVQILPGADRPVLRGVSFTVEPGEILGIIGPSGAGKSTLLRLIAGMAEPTGGGAYLDGHSTFLWERADFARHVGYVPQALALADATVAENIAGLERPDRAEVLRLARLVGLHEAILHLPHGYATRVAGFALSAGQRQRLALARALYRRPRLLLLDEPSAFLDDAGETMLVALLRDCRARGTGAVVVTHRPRIIAPADKLLVLKDGLVDRFGNREAVLQALQGPAVRLVRGSRGVAPDPTPRGARLRHDGVCPLDPHQGQAPGPHLLNSVVKGVTDPSCRSYVPGAGRDPGSALALLSESA